MVFGVEGIGDSSQGDMCIPSIVEARGTVATLEAPIILAIGPDSLLFLHSS